ncbi:tetratricopeptide repeat protein [Coralloluteibacterium thermophilus]|uniref:Tetratricopeptide repeat protein n=1 Tax=Coralloluteibacterium thermophilum TaxID=2707049 RepID=A0ABV9NMZ1_9GAMM
MTYHKLCCALLAVLMGGAVAQEDAPAAQDAGEGGRERALAPETLEAALAGEFALQGGDAAEAARRYLAAAEAMPDAGLAERATRIALLAQDQATARAALRLWRRQAPEAQGVMAASAALALATGDVEAARTDLLALIAEPDGWRRALSTLAGHRDREQVGDLLADIVEREVLPDDFQAWLAFGGLAQQLGRADLAARVVEGAVARFPDEPRAWLLQAGRHRMQGDAEAARAAIERALAAAPDDAALRLSAAGEYDALGDPQAAADTLARGEQDNASYAARASLLARVRDEPGMVALYQEVRAADPGSVDPERRLLLGQLAEYLDLPNEAMNWYRSVASGPERAQARLRMAVILDGQEQLEAARDALSEIQDDEEEDGELRRAAYLLEAELLTRRGMGTEAIALYGQALAVFEDDPELLYARALAYERADRIDLAEADLRRILIDQPDNPDVLNALGYTLADRTDRHEEALGYIERAFELRPDQPAIIDSMGWVLYRLGRHIEALAHLRRAFDLQPDAEIAAHLGEVLWVLGQEDAAREVWEQGRMLDPDNRALRRTLETYLP